MFVPPASVIVTWPRPNYVNPVSRAPIVYALDAVFLFVATVAVSIRLYTRIAIRKWVGIDDFFIVLAWVSSARRVCNHLWGRSLTSFQLLNVGVIFIVFYASSHYDWNKHLWDVRLSHIQRMFSQARMRPSWGRHTYPCNHVLIFTQTAATKSLFWLAIVWACSSAAIRLSLLFFFYRLLTHFEIRKYRWVLHCNVFFVIAIWAALVCSTVFNDNPIRAYWTFPLITSAKQDLERYSFTILSSLNTFSELLIAVLPLPVVFGKLNILPVQRWGTAVLLSLGILVAVVGGIRTFYAWKFFTEYDHSWVATPYLICSEIELDTALVSRHGILFSLRLLMVIDMCLHPCLAALLCSHDRLLVKARHLEIEGIMVFHNCRAINIVR